jgi:predicted transcriptional regulator
VSNTGTPRRPTHSDTLAFRLHPELKARLIELARTNRMTPAEAAREAVRSFMDARCALVQMEDK